MAHTSFMMDGFATAMLILEALNVQLADAVEMVNDDPRVILLLIS